MIQDMVEVYLGKCCLSKLDFLKESIYKPEKGPTQSTGNGPGLMDL